MSRSTRSGMQLSIVVPLFNEVSTIDELQRRLTSVLFLIGLRSEIIYVDDGSSDRSLEELPLFRLSDSGEIDKLLSAEEYDDFIAQGAE